jgi:hypothetical protein
MYNVIIVVVAPDSKHLPKKSLERGKCTIAALNKTSKNNQASTRQPHYISKKRNYLCVLGTGKTWTVTMRIPRIREANSIKHKFDLDY